MRIAITGAGGSLGRRLVWHCATKEHAERVVAIIRSEYALALHHDLFKAHLPTDAFERIHWMQGDVRDQSRMAKALKGCDSIVHAAALKRVDSISDNPTEIVQTNIEGVVNCLEAAMENGLKKFIFVSSDKGVAPENIYGASKMLGEHLVRTFNRFSAPRGMSCLSVRYGNVLGSRGSVYWIWRNELLKSSSRIVLTSNAMTRFFMTFKMAIDTIMAAYYQGLEGQSLIPLCRAYYLKDFLREMVHLFKKEDDSNVTVEVRGLRAGGEKYHESLVTERELNDKISVIHRGRQQYLALNSPGERTMLTGPYTPLLSSDLSVYPTNQLDHNELKFELGRFAFAEKALSQFDEFSFAQEGVREMESVGHA